MLLRDPDGQVAPYDALMAKLEGMAVAAGPRNPRARWQAGEQRLPDSSLEQKHVYFFP